MEILTGSQKKTIRESFAEWLRGQCARYAVSHMTIRRALTNKPDRARKAREPEIITAPTSEQANGG